MLHLILYYALYEYEYNSNNMFYEFKIVDNTNECSFVKKITILVF